MAETKRISDQYTISSPSIVLDGNVTISGTTTSVDTINSTIEDNIVTLNKGELGSGVTEGSSGIEIDRGSADDASWLFVEADQAWRAQVGSSLVPIKAGDPIDNDDLVTKSYLLSTPSIAGGANGEVQFNNAGSLDGDSTFKWNGTTLSIQDIAITTGSIASTTTNSDLEIFANGSGKLYLRSVVRLENEVSDPVSVVGSNLFYAKTPGNAGSGLYFTSTADSDELVSRKKSILFSLIF